MKRNNLMKLFSALLIAVMVVSLLPAAAFAADVGLGIQDMIDAQVASLGNVISNEAAKVDYQFLSGSFDDKSLSPISKNTGDALQSGDTFDASAVTFQKWQWHCDTGNDAVLKITAKENMYFKSEIQGDGQFHGGWALGSYFRFVQENAEGERKELKSIEVKDAAQSVEDSTVITHLAAGESLYIVYSAPGYSTTDFCPWFTFNAETYDATKNPFYVVPALPTYDIGVGIQDMIDAQVASLGNSISDAGAYIEYQFLSGSFDGKSLSAISKNTGDALQSGDDFSASAVTFQKWQWHCDNGNDAVLKITAKENMTFKSEIQEGGQFHAGWALGSYFRFVQENAEGERKNLKTIEVKDAAQSVEDSTVVTHLAAGESLYIVYSAPGYSTTDFCPWFTVNLQNYDETLNPFYAEEVPNPGEGENPNPGEGENPNPGEGENPNPGEGENPNPGEGENPNPGEGENPNPGGPAETGDGLSLLIGTLLGSGCALAALPLGKKRWF